MSTDSRLALLATADASRGAYLGDQLSADGFEVVEVAGAAQAVRALERTFPDVVLVDAALPDGPGLHVVSAVRGSDGLTSRVDPATPVIVLTPSDDPLDRVRALERGADDVLSLPLHYPELLARARGVLRRRERTPRAGVLRVGPLAVDPVSRTVTLDEEPVELSQKEYSLLQVLAAEPTRVFSKDELLRGVWGFHAGSRTRTLDSHACRLRQKLTRDGQRFVVNVWGVGYRLVDAPTSPTLVATPRAGGLGVVASQRIAA
jgi:DNA-binding response OmpR family regulator